MSNTETLLERVRVHAIRMARRRFCSQEDSEDIAQEVCLKLWPRLAEYDPSRASVKTFAETTINSAITDHRRKANAALRGADVLETFDENLHDVPVRRLPRTTMPTGLSHSAEKLITDILTTGSFSDAAQLSGITVPSARRKIQRLKKKV
jgi:RNA polymerase sigma factor (sigma-70 family)